MGRNGRFAIFRRAAAAAVAGLLVASAGAGAEPSEAETPHFEDVPDRWGITPPPYELNRKGSLWDPFNQNVLKGDYPIWGDDIFLKLTGISKTVVEGRSFPVPSAASAERPGEFEFFGTPDNILVDQKFAARMEIIKGSTAYKPFDWQILIEGVANVNAFRLFERGAVSPDVREGTNRTKGDVALQEAFVEFHLADLSANFDFLSLKVGRQLFNSDFRGLIFRDTNQGIRLFGNANSNRFQYNLAYFYPADKDIVSELNTFDSRDQHIAVANVYVQDFLFNGWVNQLSFHYLFDDGTRGGFVYDRLGFLARPDPVGIATPHDVEAFYLGWASEGHIGRVNVAHAFYQVFGDDSQNPIAGRATDISAQLAFLELSIDDDWLRYTVSALYASGDDDPRDGTANGFGAILDEPLIMGAGVSWFHRQTIRITDRGGVALNQRLSLIPDLRSSKLKGQPNFNNPGVFIVNANVAAEVTPELKVIANGNYIRFAETEVLEVLLKQGRVRRDAGVDLGLGIEYRPWLNNNVIVKGFAGAFVPLRGFRDVYTSETLYQAGLELLLTF